MKKFIIALLMIVLLCAVIVVWSVKADKERRSPIKMTDNEIQQAYKVIKTASGKGYVVDVNIDKTYKSLTITHTTFNTDDGRKLNSLGRKMMRNSTNKEAAKWCKKFPEIQTIVVVNTEGFQKGRVVCN